MKILVVFLAVAFGLPAYAPIPRVSPQCDMTVDSCMPVITRTRVLMVAI